MLISVLDLQAPVQESKPCLVSPLQLCALSRHYWSETRGQLNIHIEGKYPEPINMMMGVNPRKNQLEVLKPEFQIYATFTPHGVFKTFLYSGINKY
jgi:hypothetical protein